MCRLQRGTTRLVCVCVCVLARAHTHTHCAQMAPPQSNAKQLTKTSTQALLHVLGTTQHMSSRCRRGWATPRRKPDVDGNVVHGLVGCRWACRDGPLQARQALHSPVVVRKVAQRRQQMRCNLELCAGLIHSPACLAVDSGHFVRHVAAVERL
jgi:hypothetical protein